MAKPFEMSGKGANRFVARCLSRSHNGLFSPLTKTFSASASVSALRIFFRIDNLEHVRTAYGEAVAQIAIERFCAMLAHLFDDDGLVTIVSSNVVDVLLRDEALLGPAGAPDDICAWLVDFCQKLEAMRVETPAGPLHFLLSAGWAIAPAIEGGDLAKLSFDHLEACPPASLLTAPEWGAEWAQRYRDDMIIAAGLLAALDGEPEIALSIGHSGAVNTSKAGVKCSPVLVWRPIRSARSEGNIRYNECLLRFRGSEGDLYSPEPVIGALERVGLACHLDVFVFRQVIEELRVRPKAVLGVHLSTQSLRDNGIWNDTLDILGREPSLATRLVVGLTDNSVLPCITDVIRLTRRFQSLGCRVALDDFGAGYSSIDQLIALSPDIVKIDGSFLRRAMIGESRGQDRDVYIHLAGLARAVARDVIATGVDSEAAAIFALEAGIVWQQGSHWGQPVLAPLRSETAPVRTSHSAKATDTIWPIDRSILHSVVLGLMIFASLWTGAFSTGALLA